jgi:hypothetical protein
MISQNEFNDSDCGSNPLNYPQKKLPEFLKFTSLLAVGVTGKNSNHLYSDLKLCADYQWVMSRWAPIQIGLPDSGSIRLWSTQLKKVRNLYDFGFFLFYLLISNIRKIASDVIMS